jgi:hypothetical protein
MDGALEEAEIEVAQAPVGMLPNRRPGTAAERLLVQVCVWVCGTGGRGREWLVDGRKLWWMK